MPESIIITGANGNLGSAVCRKLYDEGYHIDAALGPGNQLEDHGERLHQEPVDLMKADKAGEFVEGAIRRRGRVSAGILLVGGFAMGRLKDTDPEQLDKMISLNFRTAFHMVRALFPHFEEKGGGRFVLVGAKPVFNPGAGKDLFAYTLTKTMIVKMAELINAEPTEKNIRAAVIAPSVIDTPPNREAMPDADFSDWVPPERIAEAIAFLLSDAGRMMAEPILKIYNRS